MEDAQEAKPKRPRKKKVEPAEDQPALVRGRVVEVERDELLRHVRAARSLASEKTAILILSHTKLEVTSLGVWLSATDLVSSTRARVEAQHGEPWSVCLPVKRLAEVVDSLPAGTAKITSLEGNAVEVRSGSSRFKVRGLPAADFPTVPEHGAGKHRELPWTPTAKALRVALVVASEDETRQHLSAVLFELGKRLRVVATDGHRLVRVDGAADLAPGPELTVMVPRRAAAHLLRLPAEDGATLTLSVGKAHVFFRLLGTEMTCRLPDAVFPPYEQVIPKSHQRETRAARLPLLEAVERVAVMAPTRSAGVIVGFAADHIALSAENPEDGDADESVPCEHLSDEGATPRMGVSAAYLADALRGAGAEYVLVLTSGELDPIMVCSEGYVAVTMPMRI